MALHRGIQSAIFYYVSCAPCADARYRKKRKQEAERGRAEREAIAAEMPNVYRHPSPSSTNPHWQTEIEAGPVLVSRGKKKQNTADAQRGLKSRMTQHSNESNIPSSVDLASIGGNGDERTDSKVYFHRFQRDDDELWGSPSSERLATGTTMDGSTHSQGLAIPPRAVTRGSDTASSYSTFRNPAINDLHPATVTKVNSREEAMWMMQPHPTADVMSGKTRAPRSRSDSGGSRLSAKSAVPLSREVSQRIMERRLRNGEVPSLAQTMSRESSSQTARDPKGQRHDREAIEEKDFADAEEGPGAGTNERQHATPNQISEDSAESAATVVRSPDQAPRPLKQQAQTRKVSSRPQLSTIRSDSVDPSEDESNKRPGRLNEKIVSSALRSENSSENRDRKSRCSAFLAKDDSLKVIRDLAPESAILKTHVVSSEDLLKSSRQAAKQRSPDAREEKRLEDSGLFDSWHNPDFALPDWVHEYTKRDVKQRWSMEI